MAAMVASVAAATGDTVQVFLSMNALQYFVTGNDADPLMEGEFGKVIQRKNVPPFRTLFRQAVELGEAKLLPCSMAMDLLGLTAADLNPALSEPTGLTRFLSNAESGRLMTF